MCIRDRDIALAKNSVNYGTLCQSEARKSNMLESSNTSIVRLIPLAIWCVDLDEIETIEHVKSEIKLTHPHFTVVQAAITYVLGLRLLLKEKGDNLKAWTRVKEWVEREGLLEIRDWVADVDKQEYIKTTGHINPLRVSWVESMVFLSKGLEEDVTYEKVIDEVLKRGRDIQTNAALIGAFAGAMYGFKQIPRELTQSLVEGDAASGEKNPNSFMYAASNFVSAGLELSLKILAKTNLYDSRTEIQYFAREEVNEGYATPRRQLDLVLLSFRCCNSCMIQFQFVDIMPASFKFFEFQLESNVTAQSSEPKKNVYTTCLLYTSPSPRDGLLSRMPSSA
eukprot:TRINITY_DN10938_c0_g1_i1.p1 TRINITY_DN10938_c0_g1~~TRINITY_DN10938_c0_g1_i1.p1  ORF type:complete len:337 (-),score=32.30 TRINITY_DN10938_c0_g1_i1:11-1021(-)